MKKQRNQFIILLVVLAVLIGGYFGLKAYNEYAAEAESAASVEETEVICEIAEDSVQRISYSYEGQEYTFVKEEDTWKYEADPSLNITQSSITLMETKAENLKFEEKIENVTDVSQYGLEEPERYFSFEADGKTYTFNVGDRNSISYAYYICEPDSDIVYMVESSVITIFNKTLEDLIEVEEETDEVSSGDAVSSGDEVSSGDAVSGGDAVSDGNAE